MDSCEERFVRNGTQKFVQSMGYLSEKMIDYVPCPFKNSLAVCLCFEKNGASQVLQQK